MNRMHPEDLRALIAGMFAQHLSITESIEGADHLMGRLTKTAKPEAAPTIEEVVEGRTVTVYPCPKCGETDPGAKHEASELRNKLTAAVAQLETVEAERNHAEETANLLGAQLEDAESRIKELELQLPRPGMAATLEQELAAAHRRIEELEADLRAAAKDLPVPLPKPGTEMARLLSANVLMRRRVAELEAAMERIIAGPYAGQFASAADVAAEALNR